MVTNASNEQLPDSPTMIKLKELDDKYLEIQREFEKARSELAKRYTDKQKEFITKRSAVLARTSDDSPSTGTPGVIGFWCKAIQSHEAFEDKVKDWDEPVLQHLTDVEVEKFDPETTGFKVIFRFSENPYFSNTELSVAYHSAEGNPYLETMEVEKIVSSTIEWKAGMDVTVTKVAKKVKGGGAKKGKKKEQEAPRESFFRDFTQSMHKGMTLAELANILNEDVKNLEQIDQEKDLVRMAMTLMENHFECGTALRDSIVPFAVRYYTGEACADGDDSDDDEDGESEEGSDGGDSEDSGDEADEIACDEAPEAKAAAPKGKKK